MDLLTIVVSPVVSSIIKVQEDFLRNVILNIKDETAEERRLKWLKKGDELCRGRKLPMSSEVSNKVIEIYGRYKSKGEVPLTLALEKGFADIAWGFMECAIQTNTNLHTGETGDEHLREFFWLSNKQKRTAFDILIERDLVDVATLLLNNAPLESLVSWWIRTRKTLLHLLHHPKHELFIFTMLEWEKSTRSTSTPIMIRGEQGLKLHNNGTETSVTQEFLDKLGNSQLLGPNANNNTNLHIVSMIGNVACVEYILGNDPGLIYSTNSDMETPAYVAARQGRVDNLQLLINLVKKRNEPIEPIVTRSSDNHNALHAAILNHHLEVVHLLIEEIPQLANRVNGLNESPLYLAAERGYFGVVEFILRKGPEDISFAGPKEKTALHAAAISDSAMSVEYLLKAKCDLLNIPDKQGWSALHDAVYHNSSSALIKLLEADFSIGYQLCLKDGINTSAIHIAASQGHCESMKVLIDKCPGCLEFIDIKGRNILHIAVENKKSRAIEFIIKDKSLTNLINQKDENGNTPIHLLVASDLENMEMLMDSRVHINALNNQARTPLEMTTANDQRERLTKAIIMSTRTHNKKSTLSLEINKCALNTIEEEVKEKRSEAKERKTERQFVIVDNLVVVVALIATASFAATFQVPGGYDSSDGPKQGTPFLLKKAAFQTFIVTNALAFASSCSVLLGHIALLFYRNSYDEASLEEQDYIDGKIEDMYLLTTLALIAMTIAFVTGMYVVLTPSLALAISVCALSLLLIAFNMNQDTLVGFLTRKSN